MKLYKVEIMFAGHVNADEDNDSENESNQTEESQEDDSGGMGLDQFTPEEADYFTESVFNFIN